MKVSFSKFGHTMLQGNSYRAIATFSPEKTVRGLAEYTNEKGFDDSWAGCGTGISFEALWMEWRWRIEIMLSITTFCHKT